MASYFCNKTSRNTRNQNVNASYSPSGQWVLAVQEASQLLLILYGWCGAGLKENPRQKSLPNGEYCFCLLYCFHSILTSCSVGRRQWKMKCQQQKYFASLQWHWVEIIFSFRLLTIYNGSRLLFCKLLNTDTEIEQCV